MKIVRYMILMAVSMGTLLLSLSGCDDDDKGPSTAEAEQIAKLSGTWKAVEATLDNVKQPGYAEFILKLTALPGGASGLGYVITNNPEQSPWLMPYNGRLSFDSANPTASLIREDGVEVGYEVLETTLVMTFVFTEPGSDGRSKGTSGNWKFSFDKVEP